jgi:SpoVK/Ycf46/Vps4 family AAA+-type ATPase
MPPADGSLSVPGQGPVRSAISRLRRSYAAAPLPVRALILIASCLLCVPFAGFGILALLVFAPYAVWTGRRDVWATISVMLWGIVLVASQARGSPFPHYALLVLPVVAALAAHAGALGRWFAPCRTVAWVLLLALLPGIGAFRLVGKGHSYFGPALGWLLTAVVLGWRLAKAWQDSRQSADTQHPGEGAAGAPPAWLPGQPSGQSRNGAANGHNLTGQAGPLGQGVHGELAGQGGGSAGYGFHAGQAGTQPAGRPSGGRGPTGPDGTRVMAAGRTGRTGVQGAGDGPPGLHGDYLIAEEPVITVDEAMAELDAMIGLTAVKDQVRSFAASIEAARRRAMVGIGVEKPMQHFVFLGPPGTGKTAVARIIAKIFYAFGLLEVPTVVEAQRSDLVGEYLGATAIKTNELIDSALGGVLFIDEAYSLVNEGDGQNDRFGNEAVQALLKRAEDDRDRLVIILAGYERQMDAFLASNPGLTSRFAIRIKFGGYAPAELLQLADLTVARRGEVIDLQARSVLWRMFEEVGRRRLGDELGNGRFVRTLVERAGQARDVRVMGAGIDPQASDLITLRGCDLEQAYAELTSRYRGYDETPTLESALAELDGLVGLEPVKRQVHEIAAQLRVARLRDAQGLASQPPARHFVFTGPPGTGKTTVARILARIFAALGLLVRPGVVEAHRADLVGDHLGSTAIKTNKLVDSALGGVLFIDEAYSLYNDGYSGGDAFGAESVATLLKRAEDDRDRLVIVLAGYTDDMTRFLRTNPGLTSRFSVKIAFPSYGPDELVRISMIFASQAGDSFAPDALPVLAQILARACEQGRIDELGNGRYARSLYERACASRDLRVAQLGETASAAQLTTISAEDVAAAHRGISG